MSGLEQHLPALQVVVPMLVAPLVILLKPRGLAWAACTAGSVLAFAIAIELTRMVLASGPISYAMGSWPAPYGIELRVDTLSASEHHPDRWEPRHFLNLVGFGFDIAVIDEAAKARFLKGELLYKLTALKQLFRFGGISFGLRGASDHERCREGPGL